MVVFNDTPMEEVSGVFFLTAHFVIPVISLLWRKFLECSSSPCSLRHPCVLTPMTCLLTHLIVIPDFSLESSHPSHLTLSLPSLVSPLIPYSVFSHTPTLIALTQVISSSSLTTHSHHSCYHSSHTQCSHTHPHSSH